MQYVETPDTLLPSPSTKIGLAEDVVPEQLSHVKALYVNLPSVDTCISPIQALVVVAETWTLRRSAKHWSTTTSFFWCFTPGTLNGAYPLPLSMSTSIYPSLYDMPLVFTRTQKGRKGSVQIFWRHWVGAAELSVESLSTTMEPTAMFSPPQSIHGNEEYVILWSCETLTVPTQALLSTAWILTPARSA